MLHISFARPCPPEREADFDEKTGIYRIKNDEGHKEYAVIIPFRDFASRTSSNPLCAHIKGKGGVYFLFGRQNGEEVFHISEAANLAERLHRRYKETSGTGQESRDVDWKLVIALTTSDEVLHKGYTLYLEKHLIDTNLENQFPDITGKTLRCLNRTGPHTGRENIVEQEDPADRIRLDVKDRAYMAYVLNNFLALLTPAARKVATLL